ncbi:unnamed protein product, partial [Anisakis simplex]|uniref:VWFA domain-containing protein n=1 Tax=Anisakis simplex TaxID=6269 RepID=A0A0M3JW58_ANISI
MRAHLQLLGLFALSLGLSVTFGAERQCACDYKKTWLDIVFIYDSSKKMNVTVFEEVRNFTAAVAREILISQEDGAYSRIGVINGGEEAEVVADLTKYSSSEEAANEIHKITYMNANNFNLRKSMLAARNMVEEAYKQRPNVKKLVIVFSGKSEDCVYQGKFQMKMVKPEEDQNPCRIASHIKENGGVVMTVGLKYDGKDTFPHMKFGSECYR